MFVNEMPTSRCLMTNFLSSIVCAIQRHNTLNITLEKCLMNACNSQVLLQVLMVKIEFGFVPKR